MVLYERLGRDIDQGLMGFWKFDDFKADPSTTTAIDRINFNEGIIDGATGVADMNGITNNAMSFDGNNDWVNLPNLNIGLNKGSFGAWVFSNGNSNTYIFGQQDTQNRMYIRWDSTANIFLGLGNTGNIDTGQAIIDTSWFHIMVPYDQGVWVLYINGENVATGSYTGKILDIDNIFPVGKHITAGSSFWDGLINKVRLYNRPLSDSEISKLFRLRL